MLTEREKRIKDLANEIFSARFSEKTISSKDYYEAIIKYDHGLNHDEITNKDVDEIIRDYWFPHCVKEAKSIIDAY